MKTLGLIGGISWESTALYYRLINGGIKETLGGLHSAKLLVYSFDFAEIAALQKRGAWREAGVKMIEAAQALKAGGVEALVICANTMHKLADEVEAATGLPLLHIADCTGADIQRSGLTVMGLLGTAFIMEEAFYKRHLEEKYGVTVLIPDEKERADVHGVIYDELCRGVINPASRARYEEVIGGLKRRGAQGIILGCTEICLLFPEREFSGLPLFDTTAIHARHAVAYALR